LRLNLFRSLWGVVAADGGTATLAAATADAAAAGCVGVECSVSLAAVLDKPAGAFQGALTSHGLVWSPVVFSSGPVWRGFDPFPPGTPRAAHADTVAAHVAALAGQLDAADRVAPAAVLREAVALAGHDGLPAAANAAILASCLDAAASRGFGLAFETHRGRALATPWAWRALAAALAGPSADAGTLASSLPLCLDVAHWVVACESGGVGDDPLFDEATAAAAATAARIHARVGTCQASQTRSPGADAASRDACLHYWRIALAAAAARGAPSFAATPEHGPAPYLRSGGDSLESLNVWAAAAVRRLAGEVAGEGRGGKRARG